MKKVLVLGLGRTGVSTCRYLQAQGFSVFVAEDHEARLKTALSEGYKIFTESDWVDVAFVVVSPGIPWCWPAPHPLCFKARQRGIPLTTDVDLFMIERYKTMPGSQVIAITGTNGKSTTTALMHHTLTSLGRPALMGGNIGVPALDLLEEKQGDGRDLTYVLELSSYQLELSRSVFPHTALLLNITTDHLGRHGGMAGYTAAKARIFEGLSQGGKGVIGVDDDPCLGLYEALPQEGLIPISTQRSLSYGVYGVGGQLVDALEEGEPRLMGSLEGMPALKGTHNWQNMLGVYGALRAQGISGHDIMDAFHSFPGLAHRQEVVAVHQGVTFLNDSKATNVDSVAKALPYYENIYWILGGQAKEGGLQGLEPWLPRVRHAYLIGESAASFSTYLTAHGVPHTVVGTLERAVSLAAQRARIDSAGQATVLLSPACASWDQFTSFEARGEAFKRFVHQYIQ